VVLLGAGYERAYRFAEQLNGRPSSKSISAHQPGQSRRHPAPGGVDTNVVRVEIDETQALTDVLPGAGFARGRRPSSCEGSLTRAAVRPLDAVHQLTGDGSQIAHDMVSGRRPRPLGTARRTAPSALSLIGEPVTFGVHPEDYEPFLARHGFRVIDLALASELAARYTPHVRAAVDDSMYVLAAERVAS
jgi:O-methyltransferase involved in polyketide biosynthesis